MYIVIYTSIGAYMRVRNRDLVGTEINGLKIVDYQTKGKRQYFECHCVCGFYFSSRVDAIKSGATKSCGCLTGDLISVNNRMPGNLGAINLVLRHYKNNAKKRNLNFLLTKGQFKKLISERCYYCGAEPTLSKFVSGQPNRRDRELSYNGIDRRDNSIGYVLDNCITCCHTCNRAKSDLSFSEFIKWIERLIKFNGK